MDPPRIERKLAAILSADVKGYSRLMGADEEATLRTLTAYREEMELSSASIAAASSARPVTACWLSLPVWSMPCSARW